MLNRLACLLIVSLLQGFMEIHSPKLLAGASEGGSEVFVTDYFGQPACLAQSPQLYKQMTAACGGFGRVMEVSFPNFWRVADEENRVGGGRGRFQSSELT